MANCGICDQPIERDLGNLQSAGLQRITEISNQIKDGLAEKLMGKPLPIPVHAGCRRKYTMPSTVSAAKKRKIDDSLGDSKDDCGRLLRSQDSQYNPYTDCFYCAKTIRFFKGCSKEAPTNYDHKVEIEIREHCIETMDVVKVVLGKAQERNDPWGDEVEYRLTPFLVNSDLVAIEAKYHHDCQVIYKIKLTQFG